MIPFLIRVTMLGLAAGNGMLAGDMISDSKYDYAGLFTVHALLFLGLLLILYYKDFNE
jgi:hypothetical protein